MKTILIPTDFSPAASNAVMYAVGLSKQLNVSRMILLHSYALPDPDIIYLTDILEPLVEQKEEIRLESAGKLKSLKEHLEKEITSGIEVITLSDERSLSSAIPAVIKENSIDLVITGIQGFEENKNSAGQKAVKIAAEIKCPVLLIPADASYKPVHSAVLSCELKNILSTLPAANITEFTRELNAKLFVVNIDYENRHFKPEIILEQTELHKLLDSLDSEYHYLNDEDIIHGVLQFANEKQVQMIISIPKEHGIFERLFHPSITKRLAGLTPLPLLIMHK